MNTERTSRNDAEASRPTRWRARLQLGALVALLLFSLWGVVFDAREGVGWVDRLVGWVGFSVLAVFTLAVYTMRVRRVTAPDHDVPVVSMLRRHVAGIEKIALAVSVVGLLALGLYGLGVKVLRGNLCPAKLRAMPSPDGWGIEWDGGTSTPKVAGKIVRVAVECIPIRTPAENDGHANIPALTSYQLSSTATIEYRIVDRRWLAENTKVSDLTANVVFEAQSASGVVLGTAEGLFQVVAGGESGTASADISIPEAVMPHVAQVSARWMYGHF